MASGILVATPGVSTEIRFNAPTEVAPYVGGVQLGLAFDSIPFPPDGKLWATNFRLERVTGASLLADDAVKARHVSAGAILTGHMAAGSIDVDRLNAGTFAGKVIKGATIISTNDPNDPGAENVTLTNRELSIHRTDGEGGLVTTARLGGSEADELLLYDHSGGIVSGLFADGSARVHGEASVGSLRVGGRLLPNILWQLPQGRMSVLHHWFPIGPIRNECALGATVQGFERGRSYGVRGYMTAYTSKPLEVIVRLRRKQGYLLPHFSQAQVVAVQSFWIQPGGFTIPVNFVWDSVSAAEEGQQIFALTVEANSSDGTVTIGNDGLEPTTIELVDLGPVGSRWRVDTYGGSFTNNSSPATPPQATQTLTVEYPAAWVRL